ncbi:MAG: ABC transporter ATP-binding protein [Clostridia bacterium]|nr:ABC transporter ATP-binding protein [Clostridia bacterium]
MTPVLSVEGLIKTYPGFRLGPLSFQVEAGSIMGFIGRNGAGKTTALKSVLNVVHPDAGSIRYFGETLSGNERSVKERVGYAGGAVDYYPRKKICDIVEVTRGFYGNWDDAAYRKYMEIFSLDPQKTPRELSEGMKVKLNLAIALSHRAELLILDEPTSGLDPVSREELLEIFLALKERGVAILFSTHITSDLEKCADHITYIRRGELVASEAMETFLSSRGTRGEGSGLEEIMIRCEKEDYREKLAE